MLKKQPVIFLVAGLVVFLLTATSGAARDLVAFDRGKIADARQKLDISVIAKLEDMAIGVLKSGMIDRLKAIDDTAILIEASTDIDRLWIAGCEADAHDLPGMIYRKGNFQILKLSMDDAAAVMKSGNRLSKCQHVNLPPDPLFYVPSKIPSRPSLLADVDSLMELVSVDSVEAYLQRLQDFQTRYTCTDSFWVSGQWVADKFESWGYDDVSFEEFDAQGWCTSRNVIATKVGEVYPDRYLIVGGHYDAVVYDGGDPNVFAPGVDDNGTGTAMAMEIARVLADTPFKKTVRFVTFGAEEQGLIGSWYNAMGVLNRGEDLELMINADMIGNVADSYLNFGIMCNEGGYPYGRVLADLAEEHTNLIPEISVGEFYGSDHYPYDQCGFRTVYSEEGDFSPNWHRQSDTMDNIDVDYATDIIRSNLGLLLTALITPVPVTGLQAFNVGDGHSVYLEWDPSSDDEVFAYEIYVGTRQDGVAVYDTSYGLSGTVENLDEGTNYYFGVAGITPDGGRSLIDNFVQLTPRSIPGSPESIAITPQFGSLTVEWMATPDMDFDYYQVYRKVGQEGTYQPHVQVFDGEIYFDQNLQSNIRYYYRVTQVDSTGLESDPSPEDYSKILSLDSGILLVDETRDYSGGQGNPTDAEQDSFYQFISSGYDVEFHDISQQGLLRINDIGAYSTIAWMDDDVSSQYLADIDEALAQYLDIGGNLMYVGWRSLADYGIGRPMQFAPGDFPHDYLYINEVNATLSLDFSGAEGLSGWPDLTVLPERVVPAWNGLLLGIDVMDHGDNAQDIYNYISASGDTLFDGHPVGITVEHVDYNAVFLTFPLYPMGELPARDVFATAMNFLGEQSTEVVEYTSSDQLPTVFLSQNYPNPFNKETRISFMLTEAAKVRLAIYNILGQEVAVLVDNEFPSGTHYISWDGGNLPSGVYFYRLITGPGSISRRMTLLR